MLQWNKYYQQVVVASSNPLQLRAQGLMLAEQCALFARIVCGADGLLAVHPLTRLSRKIWQYTIAGYSHEQAQTYLNCYIEFHTCH